MAELFLLKPLFPGKNELDQLSRLIGILGTPKLNDWPEGFKLIQKMGMKFPNSQGYSLESVLPMASQGAIKLISETLSWDPSKRPTASDIINNPYFDDLENNNINGGMYSNSKPDSSQFCQNNNYGNNQYSNFSNNNRNNQYNNQNFFLTNNAYGNNYVKKGTYIDFDAKPQNNNFNNPHNNQNVHKNQINYNQSNSINSDIDNYLNNFNYYNYKNNNNLIPLNKNSNNTNHYNIYGSQNGNAGSNIINNNVSKLSFMAENDLNSIKLQKEINKKKYADHDNKKAQGQPYYNDNTNYYDNNQIDLLVSKYNNNFNMLANDDNQMPKMYGQAYSRNNENKYNYNFPMPYNLANY